MDLYYQVQVLLGLKSTKLSIMKMNLILMTNLDFNLLLYKFHYLIQHLSLNRINLLQFIKEAIRKFNLYISYNFMQCKLQLINHICIFLIRHS